MCVCLCFSLTKENEIIKEQNKNLFLDTQRLEKQNFLLQQRVIFLERKLTEVENSLTSYRQKLSESNAKIKQLYSEIQEAKKLDAKYTLAVEEKLYTEFLFVYTLNT
jgi:predicted  nucleic acid-binding Zn-ribbon protein